MRCRRTCLTLREAPVERGGPQHVERSLARAGSEQEVVGAGIAGEDGVHPQVHLVEQVGFEQAVGDRPEAVRQHEPVPSVADLLDPANRVVDAVLLFHVPSSTVRDTSSFWIRYIRSLYASSEGWFQNRAKLS